MCLGRAVKLRAYWFWRVRTCFSSSLWLRSGDVFLGLACPDGTASPKQMVEVAVSCFGFAPTPLLGSVSCGVGPTVVQAPTRMLTHSAQETRSKDSSNPTSQPRGSRGNTIQSPDHLAKDCRRHRCSG
ncbi:hypothetical protein HDK90DRAFT_309871 [Phyllosticta capitalensis]|uniref:Uncharacterized protein n=1 Tax=Phyllosticta capitalensis TaxID=121624 RepID=A0ABR1YLP0_9PEZI